MNRKYESVRIGIILVTALLLLFYSAIQWPYRIRVAIFAMAGIFLGIGIMHLWIISIPDSLGFVKEALALTSGTASPSIVLDSGQVG